MPCNSDYLAASGQELESKRVAGFLVYVLDKIGAQIPEWVIKAKNDYYGNIRRLDEMTSLLCANLRKCSQEEIETIVYNAKNKESRHLADWWERHQEWDARRVKEEEETRKKIIMKDRALQKLTQEEIEALGL